MKDQKFHIFLSIVVKLMFSRKAKRNWKNLHCPFDTYLVNVKSTVKIWSIFVAFLENMNFKRAGYYIMIEFSEKKLLENKEMVFKNVKIVKQAGSFDRDLRVKVLLVVCIFWLRILPCLQLYIIRPPFVWKKHTNWQS